MEGTVRLDVEAFPASGSLFGDLGFRGLQSYEIGALTGPMTPYAEGNLDYRVQVLMARVSSTLGKTSPA